MKKIGLIGGMSWHSSMEYYRIINELVNKKIGSDHSANVVLINIDQGLIQPWIAKGELEKVYQELLQAGLSLKAAGADILGLCANGAHHYYDRLERELEIPMVHIAQATAQAVNKMQLKKVGLLGVRLTMEGTFYQDQFQKYGIEIITPEAEVRDYIHESILAELAQGKFLDSTRKKYIEIMKDLHAKGCEGVILGCTEIPMLVPQDATNFPLFPTTEIHCEALIARA